ncbi:MAG TPA: type VI secretion system tube protein Hcp [Gemmatimonadaceae bacterium]|jgi:type VI secretion system secreted protein Hcp
MAFDSYLKLDGVDGESVRSGFEKWIEIYSFSMGASNPSSIGTSGAGAGAGKVSLSGFNFMKKTDAASPKMFQMCCEGKHFPKASLILNKAGGDKSISYLKYDFTEVFVDSIQWSGASGGDDTPAESVSLAFGSVNVTYTPQKADGTPGSAVIAGWDIKKNAKL